MLYYGDAYRGHLDAVFPEHGWCTVVNRCANGCNRCAGDSTTLFAARRAAPGATQPLPPCMLAANGAGGALVQGQLATPRSRLAIAVLSFGFFFIIFNTIAWRTSGSNLAAFASTVGGGGRSDTYTIV